MALQYSKFVPSSLVCLSDLLMKSKHEGAEVAFKGKLNKGDWHHTYQFKRGFHGEPLSDPVNTVQHCYPNLRTHSRNHSQSDQHIHPPQMDEDNMQNDDIVGISAFHDMLTDFSIGVHSTKELGCVKFTEAVFQIGFTKLHRFYLNGLIHDVQGHAMLKARAKVQLVDVTDDPYDRDETIKHTKFHYLEAESNMQFKCTEIMSSETDLSARLDAHLASSPTAFACVCVSISHEDVELMKDYGIDKPMLHLDTDGMDYALAKEKRRKFQLINDAAFKVAYNTALSFLIKEKEEDLERVKRMRM